MTGESGSIRRSIVIGMSLAAACLPVFAVQQPRDDGHIAGSLVDLLDQDDWERRSAPPQTPASPQQQGVPESEAAGDRDPGRVSRPVAKQAPKEVAANAAVQLQQLIEKRHRLVDACNFFQLIDRKLKAQEKVAMADARLVQATVAANKAATDINIARAQRNEVLESRARDNLDAAQRVARDATRDVQKAAREHQRLWDELQPKITEFLALYHDLRHFVVHDRASPRLAAARGVFQRACEQRGDFHEGRVLASLCEIYGGDGAAAAHHLQNGTFFGQKLFFAWPPANDMCLAYLLLGQTAAVDPWVDWVEAIDEKRKTPTRCWLVALQGAIECKDSQAKEWFDRCGRRLIATAKKQKQPPIMPAEVAGAWASFLLTCPNERYRNLAKAEQLLEDLQPQSSWHVARASAALAAEQGRWADARRDAALAVEHGPGILEQEFKEQLAAYEQDRPWSRPRPVKK